MREEEPSPTSVGLQLLEGLMEDLVGWRPERPVASTVL